MRGTLVTISADTEKPVESRELDRPPGPGELHDVIGGYLEVIPFFDSIAINNIVMHCWCLCDEDGKRKRLPINDRANAYWARALERNGHHEVMRDDRLVGTVCVLFGDKQFMSEL